ncbi:MAG TPA: chaperone modulator CbpM [Usitatibacter sp.]|nr:chaperone modulator CbpM [Usitatibacter sp.]
MADHETVMGIALEEACLTLEQLAAACRVNPAHVTQWVSEGLFPAAGGEAREWRFTTVQLRRARRMSQLERDFDAVPELAALVADLLEEMDQLRSQMRRREPR